MITALFITHIVLFCFLFTVWTRKNFTNLIFKFILLLLAAANLVALLKL